ncbi:MAG: hypothetical protein RBS39_08495 [Phycisphaerales bacterium]|jgi:hypothetical protein|nr:hypothetical protein [Phycisphaerales bacterium]
MTIIRPLAIVASIALFAPLTAGDTFVERANALYAQIPASQRSDRVLLPVIANLEPAPRGVDRPEAAALATTDGPAWSAAETWANGATQRASLDALARVASATDARRAMAFGLPYGVQGETIDLIAAGLYTELGDPPYIAGARHLYLNRLLDLQCLVHVEATRLANEGDVGGAVKVLVDWALFARQIASRETVQEMEWGMRAMTLGFERIRDVLYNDFVGERKVDTSALRAQMDRLNEDGPLGIDRLSLPRADVIGAEQLIAAVMQERGGVREGVLGQTLAKIASSSRPLQRFSEAARYQAVAAAHANWFDTTDRLTAVAEDARQRWTLNSFDIRLKQPSARALLDAQRFAVLAASLPDPAPLFDLRQRLRVESAGTRMAMAVVGYTVEFRTLPASLPSVRPFWVQRMEIDPFNPDRTPGARPPFEFFVPVRDTKAQFAANEVPRPHEMSIVTSEGNFFKSVPEDQFVLYSWGGNNSDDKARLVQNTTEVVLGADYLVWPPIMSLLREHLIATGQTP